MEEGITKDTAKASRKQFIIILVVVCMITTIGCALVGWKWFETEIHTKHLIQENANLQETMKSKDERILACDEELEKLKVHMEGIKDNDDLLRRDIFLYIDRKFQIIPRTVALDIAEQVLKFSKKLKVSPELVVGIIEVESGFNPMSISSKNARGLMQVMPEWAKKFGLKKVSDLHDIDTGIESGIKVLKIHIDEAKGSISKGLYYYVGKSDSYSGKVYQAMGKFVAFRSTIDDDEVDVEVNGNGDGEHKEKETDDKPIEGTETGS